MEFFDFIKVVFNSKDYAPLTPGEKRKHYFLTNRRYAIQFPMQANALQHLKINQAAVMDFWNVFLSTKYKGYVPPWIYTKGVKKSVEVKEKKQSVSAELIREYCKYAKVDPKSVRDALEFFTHDMIEELKQFETILKQK